MLELKKSMTKIKNKKILLLAILAILVLVIFVLEVTDTTHIFHHKSLETPRQRSASSETKGEASNGANNSNTDTTSTQSSSTNGTDQKQPTSDETSSINLLPPDGVFVSSHHATPSSTIQSTCTTSPGAACEIIFSKNGTIKTLGAQPTDKGGGAFWTWQPKDIGLSAGSWTITAKATLGTQHKESADAMNLEVSP